MNGAVAMRVPAWSAARRRACHPGRALRSLAPIGHATSAAAPPAPWPISRRSARVCGVSPVAGDDNVTSGGAAAGAPPPDATSLGELARLFLRLGATAFGGPAAH